ncbi:MAG: carbohydrate ABC transporter permease [Ruthenibacterium sp.]
MKHFAFSFHRKKAQVEESNTVKAMDIENKALKFAIYAILLLLVIIVFTPLYIVFVLSFKGMDEAFQSNVFAFPESFTYFENFKFIWEKGNLLRAFKNTLILIVTSVIGSIAICSMISYILGRFEFKCKPILYVLLMFPVVVPAITTQVATFTVIRNLGLYNTLFAGIALYIGSDIMLIYIFLQHIEKIPYALDESARIDGASYFRIYWSIILPQLKPAIATAVIIKSLTIYNDLFTPYLYMPKTKLRTVTTTILSFVSDQTSNWGVVSAGIVIVMIPTVLMYLFMQKYIISGVTAGAVKS